MAIILAHQHLIELGIVASPFAPQPTYQPSYAVMPFPNLPVPARHLVPTVRVDPEPPRSNARDDVIAAQMPTPSELFDTCRVWGAVRSLRVHVDQAIVDNEPVSWKARVEFWHEDDAHRFEVGLGQQAILIKGWQV